MVIIYLISDEGKVELKFFGVVLFMMVGVILWVLVNLEVEGVDIFFGEFELRFEDLLCVDS